MSRESGTKIATKILGEDAREDVEEAVDLLCHWFELSLRRSKRGKAAARRLGKALRRLDVALNDKHLHYPLNLLPGGMLTRDHIRRWIDRCDAASNRPLNPADPRSDGKDWNGAFERKAAEIALELMRKHKKRISTTKGSQYEKLAAALAGRPRASFHHYCRAALKSAKAG